MSRIAAISALATVIVAALACTTSLAQVLPAAPAPPPTANTAPNVSPSQSLSLPPLPDLTKSEGFSSTVVVIALVSLLSFIPAIVLMVTSFTRIIIVLSLLRQGLGAQQLPPNQILVALSFFMSVVIMQPTWQRVNNEALQPYLSKQMDQKTAVEKALVPVRLFMRSQIERAGNDGDVDVFTDAAKLPRATNWDQVPTTALIPAFMLSELKVAFAMGFKIFLPFLIIDLVVSMLLVSAGMMMMPPVLVSLPFKLLLFVMVDGWRLITGTLIGSFAT
jgi:flagellar biosynthetic protein FliP